MAVNMLCYRGQLHPQHLKEATIRRLLGVDQKKRVYHNGRPILSLTGFLLDHTPHI